MLLSEWREFPLVPCLAGKQIWWQLASPYCWNRACRLIFFLSASVTRKYLQFGTWTDPSFQLHYRFRPRTSWSRSGRDLSAPPCKLNNSTLHHALAFECTPNTNESDTSWFVPHKSKFCLNMNASGRALMHLLFTLCRNMKLNMNVLTDLCQRHAIQLPHQVGKLFN